MTARVSLIIVNYATMEKAVKLATGGGQGADEVIVVDNASYHGDRAALEAAHPGVIFVWNPTNAGYGGGANAGAAVAGGDVLVIANPDVTVAAADLRRLADLAGDGLAAPRFEDPQGRLIRSSHRREPVWLATIREYCAPFAALAARLRPGWHPTLRPEADHFADHETLHVLGALMAVDARLFRALGGFDERFFLYREETDLCRRVRASGRKVRHVAGVVAVHEGDAASGADPVMVAARAPAVESHYRYIAKHRGGRTARWAWRAGYAGSILWWITGPDRRSAGQSLRSHRRLTGPSGRGVFRPPSPPA